MSTRRAFIKKAALSSAAISLPISSFANIWPEPAKYKMSLNPGAIGVSMPMEPLLKMAAQYGFKSLTPDLSKYRKLSQEERKSYMRRFKNYRMSWDAAGVPFDFRNDEKDFKIGINKLVVDAITLQSMGVTRMSTWIMPTHGKFTYRENFELHRERLAEVANRLLPYGINLGLEYVGPKTLMARDKFSFIRTMKELTELITAIDMPNVGYQLDAFHWYCAGETVEDIKALDPKKIVTVDLNDAKEGRTADEQLDWERELPGKSGIINLQGFLSTLREIGYDGPVRAEPFNKALGEKDNRAAIADTAHWMKYCFVQASE